MASAVQQHTPTVACVQHKAAVNNSKYVIKTMIDSNQTVLNASLNDGV
jgi:hypothetical protein